MKIAIIGATGYIGNALIDKLIESTDYEIAASYRSESTEKRLINKKVQWGKIDLNSLQNIEDFLIESDVLVYLVHSLDSSNFESLDIKFANNVGKSAKKVGIKKIIYIGVITPSNEKLSAHLKSKKNTGEILYSYGIPVAEIRLSILLGLGSSSYKLLYFIANNFPIIIGPKELDNYCSPIGVKDATDAIISSIKMNIIAHQIFEIGSEKLRYSELLSLCRQSIKGHKNIIITTPIFPIKLAALIVSILSKTSYSLTSALMGTLANNTSYSKNRFKEITGRNPMRIKEVFGELL